MAAFSSKKSLGCLYLATDRDYFKQCLVTLKTFLFVFEQFEQLKNWRENNRGIGCNLLVIAHGKREDISFYQTDACNDPVFSRDFLIKWWEKQLPEDTSSTIILGTCNGKFFESSSGGTRVEFVSLDAFDSITGKGILNRLKAVGWL